MYVPNRLWPLKVPLPKKAKKKATAQAAAGICEVLPLGSSKPLSSSVLVAEHSDSSSDSDCAALGPGTSAVG